jgi:hypothetical protein
VVIELKKGKRNWRLWGARDSKQHWIGYVGMRKRGEFGSEIGQLKRTD